MFRLMTILFIISLFDFSRQEDLGQSTESSEEVTDYSFDYIDDTTKKTQNFSLKQASINPNMKLQKVTVARKFLDIKLEQLIRTYCGDCTRLTTDVQNIRHMSEQIYNKFRSAKDNNTLSIDSGNQAEQIIRSVILGNEAVTDAMNIHAQSILDVENQVLEIVKKLPGLIRQRNGTSSIAVTENHDDVSEFIYSLGNRMNQHFEAVHDAHQKLKQTVDNIRNLLIRDGNRTVFGSEVESYEASLDVVTQRMNRNFIELKNDNNEKFMKTKESLRELENIVVKLRNQTNENQQVTMATAGKEFTKINDIFTTLFNEMSRYFNIVITKETEIFEKVEDLKINPMNDALVSGQQNLYSAEGNSDTTLLLRKISGEHGETRKEMIGKFRILQKSVENLDEFLTVLRSLIINHNELIVSSTKEEFSKIQNILNSLIVELERNLKLVLDNEKEMKELVMSLGDGNTNGDRRIEANFRSLLKDTEEIKDAILRMENPLSLYPNASVNEDADSVVQTIASLLNNMAHNMHSDVDSLRTQMTKLQETIENNYFTSPVSNNSSNADVTNVFTQRVARELSAINSNVKLIGKKLTGIVDNTKNISLLLEKGDLRNVHNALKNLSMAISQQSQAIRNIESDIKFMQLPDTNITRNVSIVTGNDMKNASTALSSIMNNTEKILKNFEKEDNKAAMESLVKGMDQQYKSLLVVSKEVSEIANNVRDLTDQDKVETSLIAEDISKIGETLKFFTDELGRKMTNEIGGVKNRIGSNNNRIKDIDFKLNIIVNHTRIISSLGRKEDLFKIEELLNSVTEDMSQQIQTTSEIREAVSNILAKVYDFNIFKNAMSSYGSQVKSVVDKLDELTNTVKIIANMSGKEELLQISANINDIVDTLNQKFSMMYTMGIQVENIAKSVQDVNKMNRKLDTVVINTKTIAQLPGKKEFSKMSSSLEEYIKMSDQKLASILETENEVKDINVKIQDIVGTLSDMDIFEQDIRKKLKEVIEYTKNIPQLPGSKELLKVTETLDTLMRMTNKHSEMTNSFQSHIEEMAEKFNSVDDLKNSIDVFDKQIDTFGNKLNDIMNHTKIIADPAIKEAFYKMNNTLGRLSWVANQNLQVVNNLTFDMEKIMKAMRDFQEWETSFDIDDIKSLASSHSEKINKANEKLNEIMNLTKLFVNSSMKNDSEQIRDSLKAVLSAIEYQGFQITDTMNKTTKNISSKLNDFETLKKEIGNSNNKLDIIKKILDVNVTYSNFSSDLQNQTKNYNVTRTLASLMNLTNHQLQTTYNVSHAIENITFILRDLTKNATFLSSEKNNTLMDMVKRIERLLISYEKQDLLKISNKLGNLTEEMNKTYVMFNSTGHEVRGIVNVLEYLTNQEKEVMAFMKTEDFLKINKSIEAYTIELGKKIISNVTAMKKDIDRSFQLIHNSTNEIKEITKKFQQTIIAGNNTELSGEQVDDESFNLMFYEMTIQLDDIKNEIRDLKDDVQQSNSRVESMENSINQLLESKIKPETVNFSASMNNCSCLNEIKHGPLLNNIRDDLDRLKRGMTSRLLALSSIKGDLEKHKELIEDLRLDVSRSKNDIMNHNQKVNQENVGNCMCPEDRYPACLLNESLNLSASAPCQLGNTTNNNRNFDRTKDSLQKILELFPNTHNYFKSVEPRTIRRNMLLGIDHPLPHRTKKKLGRKKAYRHFGEDNLNFSSGQFFYTLINVVSDAKKVQKTVASILKNLVSPPFWLQNGIASRRYYSLIPVDCLDILFEYCPIRRVQSPQRKPQQKKNIFKRPVKQTKFGADFSKIIDKIPTDKFSYGKPSSWTYGDGKSNINFNYNPEGQKRRRTRKNRTTTEVPKMEKMSTMKPITNARKSMKNEMGSSVSCLK